MVKQTPSVSTKPTITSHVYSLNTNEMRQRRMTLEFQVPDWDSVNTGGVKSVVGIPTPISRIGSQTAIIILTNDY